MSVCLWVGIRLGVCRCHCGSIYVSCARRRSQLECIYVRVVVWICIAWVYRCESDVMVNTTRCSLSLSLSLSLILILILLSSDIVGY